jgi:transcriptional antiterminator RfaH
MQPFKTEHTWFLAQIRPNCQKMAEQNLRRQNFQTFLPMHEETKRRSGRFVSTLRPLFSGYIFVAFDTARGGWQAINSTYGVTQLVSFGGEPRSVPHDLISRLMLRCDERGKLLPPRILRPGETVKISEGPFSNFIATVEKISRDQRVWVLLDLMGQSTRVAVQSDALQTLK